MIVCTLQCIECSLKTLKSYLQLLYILFKNYKASVGYRLKYTDSMNFNRYLPILIRILRSISTYRTPHSPTRFNSWCRMSYAQTNKRRDIILYDTTQTICVRSMTDDDRGNLALMTGLNCTFEFFKNHIHKNIQ